MRLGIRSIYEWLRPRLGPKVGVLRQYPPRPLKFPSHVAHGDLPHPTPLISIVTPSYNQAAFLERTIRSVLDQGYPRLEYIVQDGGSTDGTLDILRHHAASLAHWESAPDRGQAHALNLGFRHATGDILAYLNSDDVLLPGALAEVARFFAVHPEVDVVYSHRLIIDTEDREIGRWILPAHDNAVLAWQDFIPQETLLWRRRLWERVGGCMDESFHFALDWDLLLRFRDAGARFVRLPCFLGAFRVHPEQKTSARFEELHEPEVSRLRERCHGRFVRRTEVLRAVRPYLLRHVLHHHLHQISGLVR
jgi:glycosyltransferase involved in cell wall biosynthesis